MRIKLAGGAGEYGRNCFLVQGNTLSFLVDCGLMVGAQYPWPHLDREEIQSLDYVFLTHSHNDHSGALSWLAEQGFTGTVAASRETLRQIQTLSLRAETLEAFCPPKGLTLKWGRTGHCAGSVWFYFALEGKSLLFSGDYTEKSLAYTADPIRNVSADIAVLDSAYGYEKRTAGQMRAKFMEQAAVFLDKKSPLLLPVPKYGRGLELALMIHRRWPEVTFYGDEHFTSRIEGLKCDTVWCTEELREGLADLKYVSFTGVLPKQGIIMISDPQLKKGNAETLAAKCASEGGVILTGAVEANSGSDRLLKSGKAVFCRIPVHCSYDEAMSLAEKNRFHRVIPVHSGDVECIQKVIFI